MCKALVFCVPAVIWQFKVKFWFMRSNVPEPKLYINLQTVLYIITCSAWGYYFSWCASRPPQHLTVHDWPRIWYRILLQTKQIRANILIYTYIVILWWNIFKCIPSSLKCPFSIHHRPVAFRFCFYILFMSLRKLLQCNSMQTV